MIIYIPNHLEQNLPIVRQLSSMIQEYSKIYGNQDSLGSFDYYYTHYNSDAVKAFIELCLPWDPKKYSNEAEYSGVISYLVKLFYSVKGTYLVFPYMEKYLGIEFVGKIKYTINRIEFEISEVTAYDISVYISKMKGFLSALLYYGDLAAIIDIMNLKIEEIISNNISIGIKRYKEFTVTKEYGS